LEKGENGMDIFDNEENENDTLERNFTEIEYQDFYNYVMKGT
jgi:hypothetical protein